MSWKKFFKVVDTNGSFGPVNGNSSASRYKASDHTAYGNYGNMLPEVYMGHPNRIERYNQYENMDADSEVNAALDILAEFCTQIDEKTNLGFQLFYKDKPTETESKILKTQLEAWHKLNEFDRRIFRMFRNTLKYGDQVFVRDPETFKLFWTDMVNVTKVIVNESDGKKPEQYVIKNLNPNFETMAATQIPAETMFSSNPNNSGSGSGGGYTAPSTTYQTNGRFSHGINEWTLDASNIVHMSLTEGLDSNWPFGNSILELIFKVYKQKELLEDAIIIYRVQRAPERRIFKIDVGEMPSHMAMAFVDRIKNEMYQRRIPTQDGGCFDLTTKIPLLDGRILELQQLIEEYKSGKQNWIYSCNPADSSMVPGLISWAGVTKTETQVIKLTLDNGKTLIVTPEHKIPILGKGKIEAKDIVPGVDSLISFHTRMYGINDNNTKKSNPEYQQVYDHKLQDWVFTHRMVANYFKDRNLQNELVFDQKYVDFPKRVIHHKDINRLNNNPENLAFMYGRDHFKLHSDSSNNFWKVIQNDPIKLANYKIKRSECSKEAWKEIKKDTTKYSKLVKGISTGRKQFLKDPAQKELLLKNLKNQQKKPWGNQELLWDNQCVEILKKYILESNSDKKQIAILLSNDSEFMKKYQSLNMRQKGINHLIYDKILIITLMNLVRYAGYKTWKDLIKDLRGEWKRKGISCTWNKKLFDIFIQIYNEKTPSLNDMFTYLSNNEEFLLEFKKLNQLTHNGNKNLVLNFNKVTYDKIQSLLITNGYKNWSDFKEKVKYYNHKIVSIEWLKEKIDVGTITVDGQHKYHDYHTFATDAGVFVYNSNFFDSTYSPIGMNEDFFFPVTASGRGSDVTTLAGGQNLGEIDDLRFFTNKMLRGLRIPSSYLPTGQEDGAAVFNDGKATAALIQEFRFNQYCKRLQALLGKVLDTEFKAFLKWTGVNIDSSTFDLKFNEPQNFAHYRQAELDNVKIQTFTQLEQFPYLSKRFLMTRYLGLTVDDLVENDTMWREEHMKASESAGEQEAPDLRNVGITPGGIEGDLENILPPEEGMPGEEGGPELPGGETGTETPGGAGTPIGAPPAVGPGE